MTKPKYRRATTLAALLVAVCVLSATVSARESGAAYSSDKNSASSAVSETDTTARTEPADDSAGEKIDTEEFAKQVIAHTNAARKEQGLSELKTMEMLTKAAGIRAKELEKSYSHTRPDGEKWSTVFKELEMKSKARAENIAWGYKDPKAVTNAWLESTGHRKNIMNEKYNYIAVAVHITETGEIAWEQLFCK